MIESVDLIEDRLHLDAVVVFDTVDRRGEVAAASGTRTGGIGERGRRSRAQAKRGDQPHIVGAQVGIDLGREEVVDIGARCIGRLGIGIVAVDDVIGRMLIRPRRPQVVAVGHRKQRVGAHEIVRPHRCADATGQLSRQVIRVDRHRAVEAGQARGHAAIDGMQVLIEILREVRLRAGT